MNTRNARPRLHERMEAVRLEEVEPPAQPHCCEWPGCHAHGEFPAPRGRSQLRDFMLLCLDHVREYNSSWNYFDGMSDDEVEAHRRADTTWHRPSWPFASGIYDSENWRDPFDLFGDAGMRDRTKGGGRAEWETAAPDRRSQEMMQRLGLQPGFAEDELKRRYKAMAKANHPDLNPGDAKAGERLRAIIEAYDYLRERHTAG
ncbi:MAG: DnaJ domain-containing protein [Geminicoccaceae bacterium]